MNISGIDTDFKIKPYFEHNILQYKCGYPEQSSKEDRQKMYAVVDLLNRISLAGFYVTELSYSDDEGFSLDYILLNKIDTNKNPFTPNLSKVNNQWTVCIKDNLIKDLDFLKPYDVFLVNDALRKATEVCSLINLPNKFEFSYTADK